MHPELDKIPKCETPADFCFSNKEIEAFFSVSPDNSMICTFPYHSIEAITHVVSSVRDLCKKETMSIIMSGQQSIIIQGALLYNVRFALQSRMLTRLRTGYAKDAAGSDTPFVVASIQIQLLGGDS